MSLGAREELVISPSTQEWWQSTGPFPEEWEPNENVPNVFSERYVLPDEAVTTVHIFRRELGSIAARAVNNNPKMRPTDYLRTVGDDVVAAMSGGFYHLGEHMPMGELWIAGEPQLYVPFEPPWDESRGTVHFYGDEITINRRDSVKMPKRPKGDLIQAGPLLVLNGVQQVYDHMEDPEGFRATRGQHDGNRAIVDGRFPRSAIGRCAKYIYGLVVDGRTGRDAGMTAGELAAYGQRRGLVDLLNMDGGGTAFVAARDKQGIHLIVNKPMNVADSARTYPPDPPGIPDGVVYPTPGGCRETHTMIVFTEVA